MFLFYRVKLILQSKAYLILSYLQLVQPTVLGAIHAAWASVTTVAAIRTSPSTQAHTFVKVSYLSSSVKAHEPEITGPMGV